MDVGKCLDLITQKIESRVEELKEKSHNSFGNIEKLTEYLVELQIIKDNLVLSARTLILNELKNETKGVEKLYKLSTILRKDDHGKFLLKDHKIFDVFNQELFNQKTLNFGIDKVISIMEGSNLNKDKLIEKYVLNNTVRHIFDIC